LLCGYALARFYSNHCLQENSLCALIPEAAGPVFPNRSGFASWDGIAHGRRLDFQVKEVITGLNSVTIPL